MSRTRSPRPVGRRSPPRRAAVVRTRQEWHDLLGRVGRACEAWPQDELERLRLAHAVRDALTGVFQQECGYAAFQVAGAWIEMTKALLRPETPEAMRAELAPVVKATAGLLENRLWDAAHRAFAAAHANRPEVMG